MIDKQNDLVYSKFFLIEFLEQIQKKGAGRIEDIQFQNLSELSGYLLQDENIIVPIERLARYQGTNEFAIFLFDMMGRVEDYSAEMIYASLPDLVDDFINLYNLMIEDSKSVADLNNVLEEFRNTYRREEKPTEVVFREKQISFSEFFNNEFLSGFNILLDRFGDDEKKARYLAVANTLLQHVKGKKEFQPDNYDSQIKAIIIQLENIFPKDDDVPSTERMDFLQDNLNEFLQNIGLLETEAADLFKEIISTGQLPEKEEGETKKLHPEELPEEPVTIDNLLHDYFKTEVNDHIEMIRFNLSPQKVHEDWPTVLKQVIKNFKSLKEISMIHGYNGIEHCVSGLINLLILTYKKEQTYSEDTLSSFAAIINELQNVEQFLSPSKNDPGIVNFDNLVSRLADTFSAPTETETVPVEEDLISINDEEKALDILCDLYKQIYKKVSYYHEDIRDEDNFSRINNIIRQLEETTNTVFPVISEKFFNPLLQSYRIVRDLESAEADEVMIEISGIWQKFLGLIHDPLDLSELDEMFKRIVVFRETEADLISLEEEDTVGAALVEAQITSWQKEKEKLRSGLIEGIPSDLETLTGYFSQFESNIVLAGFDNYLKIAVSFIGYIKNREKYQFTESLVFELEKSFELVLERLKAQGRSGNCDDIVEVLEELMQPLAKAEETEEEDDRAIFMIEFRQHLDRAKEALIEVEKDPNHRESFNHIENAIHSIKTSAQLLNIQNVADLAAPIEDIAEVFGKSSIPVPGEVSAILKTAFDGLQEISTEAQAQKTELIDKLGGVLDSIMIEDAEPAAAESSKQEVTEEAAPIEKPLFAEQEESDDDLLDLFQQEVKSFLTIIDAAHSRLAENNEDADALNKFEYAAHSLKSAAKMLGFREIAELTDGMETVIESIKNKDIKNTTRIHDSLGEAIETVKQLSQGKTVTSSDLARIINILEIPDYRTSVQEQAEIDHHAPSSAGSARELVGDYFIEEASELLTNLNMDLLELEKMPQSETHLARIQRNLHTLKGSAMMLKHERIGELSHRLEDFFLFFKEQRGEMRHEILSPVFAALDLIEELVQGVANGEGDASAQFMARLAEIDNKLFLYQNFETGAAEEKSTATAAASDVAGKIKKTAEDDNTIKISTSHLDSLVNMATELVVNRTELGSYFDNLKKLIENIEQEKRRIHLAETLVDDLMEEQEYREQDKAESSSTTEEESVEPGAGSSLDNLSSSFKEILSNVSDITSELNKLSGDFEKNISRISNLSNILHSDILKVRMVPVENLFNRFPRPVRDLARSQKKKIDLSFEGADTELDRAMIEALVDPLMHLIRNAVDHGIEIPKERKNQNKDEAGSVIIRARQDKNQVVIEVSDDGRGIELEKVKKTIVKSKLATKKEVAAMSEAEVLDYLFTTEFSTREETTEVSGRGIGLDVVANHIQKLKGNIRIKTKENEGTTFSIRVPLTLIISQALMTKSHGQTMAIPVGAVQESIEVKSENILMDDNRKYLQVRGKLLPYITLDELLHFEEENNTGSLPFALIIHDAGVSVALGIHELYGRQEIVIKTLGSHLQNVEYIAGGTILGNGEVALILDYAAVIRSVELQFFGNVSDRVSTRKENAKKPRTSAKGKQRPVKSVFKAKYVIKKKTIADRKPRILVVDDSSSVRNFVGGVLEKMGFATKRSSDGEAAIEIVENELVDLIITDLEMPEMHGFTFISHIRKQDRFKELPIVILTGKSGQDMQDEGAEKGANAFISKPFKENDLLDVIAKFIVSKA